MPWAEAVECLVFRGWMHVADAVDRDLVEELADEDRRGGVFWATRASFVSMRAARTCHWTARAPQRDEAAPLSSLACPVRPSREAFPPSHLSTRSPGAATRKEPAASPSTPIPPSTAVSLRSSRSEAPPPFGSSIPTPRWSRVESGPGQLALLRGAGWPHEGSRCPLHEVDPPSSGERMIMTLRSNSAGAGAGYTV